MTSEMTHDGSSLARHDTHAGERDVPVRLSGRSSSAGREQLLLEQVTAVHRQLRDLLHDASMRAEPELRPALADELLQEIEVLGLALQRPAVRQAAARVRRAVGLPLRDIAIVPMSVDTALAFLSLAIDPPGEMTSGSEDLSEARTDQR